MAPLVRSGSAIGMGRYPPIDPHQRCRLSSAAGQSMQICNSWPTAIKRMKWKWEGWDECRRLKELEVRANAAYSARPSNVLASLVRKTGITCNIPSSKYHTPVRFFSSSKVQGTLLRI
jgi:hypothetical protein